MHGHGFAKWYCEQVPQYWSLLCILHLTILHKPLDPWTLRSFEPQTPGPLDLWPNGCLIDVIWQQAISQSSNMRWPPSWEPVGSSECMKCMLWVKFQCSIWTSMFSIIDWEPIAYHSTSLQTCKQQIMQIDDFLTTCIIFETTCSSVPLSAPPCLFLHLRASFFTSVPLSALPCAPPWLQKFVCFSII